jgi:LPXTG-motif cell wall-anchored protein
MSRKFVSVLAVTALMLGAAVAVAQVTTHEVREATVVAVYGNNLVIENQDGEIKEFEIPEDFRFDLDGKMVPVSEIKPGTKLSATVTTTTMPQTIERTEIRNGTVLHVAGRNLIVRTEDKGVQKFTVPGDFIFNVDGNEKTVFDLRKGDQLTATILHHEPAGTVTETELASIVKATDTSPKPAPAPKTAPAPAPAPVYTTSSLPSTGSQLPLIGLAGLCLVLVGLGLAVIRRF